VIAVISDIHGNLEALEAVLADAGNEGATDIICLGDIVGYGADPNRCVELVRERAAATVLGNHDAAALDLEEAEEFNPLARDAILWTRRTLSPASAKMLRSLPLVHVREGARFVHASPEAPESWPYVLNAADAQFALGACMESVCFIGHTHVPTWMILENGLLIDMIVAEQLELREGGRALINVGSVGQPRDGDWRASYVLFDPAQQRVIARRVEYALEAATEKILAAGLPGELAHRLSFGR
jgi:diadenosine tetraphosphatase ApaH/serine/threonine PP2A family protein phosphatase